MPPRYYQNTLNGFSLRNDNYSMVEVLLNFSKKVIIKVKRIEIYMNLNDYKSI